MNHYVTYFQKLKPKKGTVVMSNPEMFLLSGGKKGIKNLNLLNKTDRVTRLSVQSIQSLHNSSYVGKLDLYLPIMESLNHRIAKFFKENNKEDCYHRFSIPKSSGGLRWIDAPNEDLMHLQRQVVQLLEYMGLVPHNNAHAYVAKRSIATNADIHKDSNHFLKLDLTKFFPSITSKVLNDILPQIGVLAYVNYDRNMLIQNTFKEFLQSVIQVATLKDSLPQGTPLSPLLSNLIMIPFDYHLTEALKAQPRPIIVTRYADDLTFSSFYAFADRKEDAKIRMETLVNTELEKVFGPNTMLINQKKTTVSTKFGKNRITGIKVNGLNKVSIGYKEKQKLKKNLAKLIIMKKNGELDTTMAQEVIGYYNFLHSIEPDYARYMMQTLERKFNIPYKLTKWIYN